MMSQNGTAANKDPMGFLLEMNAAHPNNGKVVPRNRGQLKKPPPQWNSQNNSKDINTNSQRKNLKKPPPPPPPQSVPSFYPELKDEPSDTATATATITDDSNSLSGSFASFLGNNDYFVRTNENTILDISELSNSMTQRRREVSQAQLTSSTRIMSGSRSQVSDDGSLSVHHLFSSEEDGSAAGYGYSSLRRGAESSSRRQQPYLHQSYSEGLGPSYRSDSRSGSSQPRRHYSNPGAPRGYYPDEGAPDRQFRPPTSQRRSHHHDQTSKMNVPPPPRRYHEGPSARCDHKDQGRYYEQGGSMYDDRDNRGYYPDPYVQEERLPTRSGWGEMAKSESYLSYVQDSHQDYPLFQEDAASHLRYDDHHYGYSQGNGRARGYPKEPPREARRRHGRAMVGTDERNHHSLSELGPRQEESHGGAAPNSRNVSRSASHNTSTKPAAKPGAFPVVGRGKLEIPQSCLRRASFELEDSSSLSPRSSDGEKKPAPTSIVSNNDKEKGMDDVYVQVAPGVEQKLRRVVETKNAIKAGFYTSGMCWGCCVSLCCVSDASFLICPNCTVISPLEDCVSGSYGVGVGFTNELLEQIKEEARNDARAA